MAAARATPAPAFSRPPIKPKLLVVDDEPGIREGIRRTLEKRGVHATPVGSGAEALALMDEHEFPIVLVDLKMPGMDGFDVIERIKQRLPETICIVVSAFATIESAVQSTKKGAFDFVVKPFAPDDLMRVVDRAADTWRLARETARLRAEREAHLFELIAEKSRSHTIIHSMGQGLLVINIDGEIVLDNPVARRLLGRVTATPSERPKIASVLDDPDFLDAVHGLIGGARTANAIEIDVVRKRENAENLYLRATLAPVRDERGRGLGVVVLLANVTDAKNLDRAKNLFISMVAHEVKAPIAAVESYLNLIMSGALDAQLETQKRILSRCLARTGALNALVEDLLEITRRETFRQKRRLEPVDLAALVTEMMSFHSEPARSKGVKLSLEAESALPKLRGDRHEIERLLNNLLSNAIKYNRENGEVRVLLTSRGGALALEVRDTGVGMSAEEVARLGEEFFRAKNPKTRHVTGTGLGLSLVRKIVESYNGALEVASVLDQGSTFRVLLPVPAGDGAPS